MSSKGSNGAKKRPRTQGPATKGPSEPEQTVVSPAVAAPPLLPPPAVMQRQAERTRGGVLALLRSVTAGAPGPHRSAQERRAHLLAAMMLPYADPYLRRRVPGAHGHAPTTSPLSAQALLAASPIAITDRDPQLPTPEGEVRGRPLAAMLEQWATLTGAGRRPTSYEAVQQVLWQLSAPWAAPSPGAVADDGTVLLGADADVWDARRGRVVRLLGPTLVAPGEAGRVLQVHAGDPAPPGDLAAPRKQVVRVMARAQAQAQAQAQAHAQPHEAQVFDVEEYVRHVQALREGDAVEVLLDVPAFNFGATPTPDLSSDHDASLAPLPARVASSSTGLRLQLLGGRKVVVPALGGDAALAELHVHDRAAPWRSHLFVFGRKDWLDQGRPLFSRRRLCLGTRPLRPLLIRTHEAPAPPGGGGSACWWPMSPLHVLPATSTALRAVGAAWIASGLLPGLPHRPPDAGLAAMVEFAAGGQAGRGAPTEMMQTGGAKPKPAAKETTDENVANAAGAPLSAFPATLGWRAPLMAFLAAAGAARQGAAQEATYVSKQRAALRAIVDGLQREARRYAASGQQGAPPDAEPEAVVAQGHAAPTWLEAAREGDPKGARKGARKGDIAARSLTPGQMQAGGVRGAMLLEGARALGEALAGVATLSSSSGLVREYMQALVSHHMQQVVGQPCAAPRMVGRPLPGGGPSLQELMADEALDGGGGAFVQRLLLSYEDASHYRAYRASPPPQAPQPSGERGARAADGGPATAALLGELQQALAAAGQASVSLAGLGADTVARVQARAHLLLADEEEDGFSRLRARIGEVKRQRAVLMERVDKRGAAYEAFEARLLEVIRRDAQTERLVRAVVKLCALLGQELGAQAQAQAGGGGDSLVAAHVPSSRRVSLETLMAEAAHHVLQAHLADVPVARKANGPPRERVPAKPQLARRIAQAAAGMGGPRPKARRDLSSKQAPPLEWPRYRPLGVLQPLDMGRAQGAPAMEIVRGLHAAVAKERALVLGFDRRPLRHGVNACCMLEVKEVAARGGTALDALARRAPALQGLLQRARAGALGASDRGVQLAARPQPVQHRHASVVNDLPSVDVRVPAPVLIQALPAAVALPAAATGEREVAAAAAAVARLLTQVRRLRPAGLPSALLDVLVSGLGQRPLRPQPPPPPAPAPAPPAKSLPVKSPPPPPQRPTIKGGAAPSPGPSSSRASAQPPAALNASLHALARGGWATVQGQVRPREGAAWDAVRASYMLDAPDARPVAAPAPWHISVTVAAAFLVMDLAIALSSLGGAFRPRDASGEAVVAFAPPWRAASTRIRRHEPAADLAVLIAAAPGLSSTVAEAGRAIGAACVALQAADGQHHQQHQQQQHQQHQHQQHQLLHLASTSVFCAMAAMQQGGRSSDQLADGVATLCALLLEQWAQRLQFMRDDAAQEEALQLEALREERKQRKLAIQQRLDDRERELVRDMKKMRLGGVDWDAVERDLAAEPGSKGALPARGLEATPLEQDGMHAYWSGA